MPTPARVVVLPQDELTLRLMDIQLPDPSPYEVVVQQFATGLCHSQLHQIHSPTPRESALLIGHESTGVVVAKGGRVKHVKEGDRVMTTWLPRDLATADHTPERTWYTLPDGTVATTGRTFMFTFGDNVIADEQHVVPLPDDVPTDVTAIIGCPVMTGAGAVRNTAGVQAGQSVAVFGAGGVGLSAIAAAAVIGSAPIIAVDVAEDKLAFAKRFGATMGVDATAGDPVERIHDLTNGGVDFAFDCMGATVTMQQTLAATKYGVWGGARGGTAVLVGVPVAPVDLDMDEMLSGQRTYLGSLGGSSVPDRDFPLFLEWFREGHLDLTALVTQRYRLEEINEGFAALARGEILGRAIIEL